MLELHCHTTYSDGTLTPRELVAAAAIANVSAIAITDHDTIAGWGEARVAARRYGIEIVPGVELSTVHRERSLHLLGYYPDPASLESPLAERQLGRRRRAQAMVQRLTEMGYPVTLTDDGKNKVPGRPHVAAAMVAAGYVRHVQEAFERFLGEGKPAYVCYEKFTAIEGLQLIRAAGGVPVWAHPYLFRGGDVATVLPELVGAGLMGLEVYHPGHRPRQVHQLLQACEHYRLLITGGSDYHGPGDRPTGKHATTLNRFKLPTDLLDPIREAAERAIIKSNL